VAALVFSPGQARARSVEGALDDLAGSLTNQIRGQQVASLTILPFTNLSGAQTTLERYMAETLEHKMAQRGAPTFIASKLAARAERHFSIPPGTRIDGETAARIGKHVGADAVIVPTIESYGAGVLELRAEVFSSQGAVNIASARSSADEADTSNPSGSAGAADTAGAGAESMAAPDRGSVAPDAKQPLLDSVWQARLEPSADPWWNECHQAEVQLASGRRLLRRCFPGDRFESVPSNSWYTDHGSLVISFDYGRITHVFPNAADATAEISAAQTGAREPILHLRRKHRATSGGPPTP
jgi:hypothetical protein